MSHRYLIAFDSYKGCLTAEQACRTVAEGIKSVEPDAQIIQIPLSDGGEGLVNCIAQTLPTRKVSLQAHGPLGEIIPAEYRISEDGKTAYIEMSATCGMNLVEPNSNNILFRSTYGVGDMILHAKSQGCKQILMGIGGSCTCDGGRGMVNCFVENGYNIKTLSKLVKMTVACDVENPMYGPKGAAYVYGSQKGATPEQILELDKRLKEFHKLTMNRGLARARYSTRPGTGAAGGLGYALMTYLGAELKSGIDIVLDYNHFDERLKNVDIVITGEGKSDAQTLMGKVPQGVLHRCEEHEIPVWLLSGSVEDPNGDLAKEFQLVRSINEGDIRSQEELMKPEVAVENLKKTIASIIKG